MKYKTALITGGTDGVGLSIVKALVKSNFNVYFIGSNKEKGRQVETDLREISDGKIEFVALDLSDLKEVKSFAEAFSKQQDQLDLLINVAGVILPSRQTTTAGTEKTFTIGYLSSFILCNELVPNLQKAEHPRILNVSGGVLLALKLKLDFDDLDFNQRYNGFLTAAKTVHAKTVLADILAEKLASKNIDVNAFHPGIVKSGLGRNIIWPLNRVAEFLAGFMSKESKTGIYASLSSSMNGVSGNYLVNRKRIPLTFPNDYKERLWNQSEKLVNSALET